jgi:hypothetical protein
MALNKDKLKARMQASSPLHAPTPAIPLTDLTAKPTEVKAPDRTTERPNGYKPRGVPKRTRAKDGVQRTQRYSFEITHELKSELEQAVLQHQLDTGKKISTSSVIRTAIEQHLKRGKL